MRNTWVKPTRTAIQGLIGLIPALPFLVPALGLSATAGVGALVVTVATVAARLMAIPAVERILHLLGLKTPDEM